MPEMVWTHSYNHYEYNDNKLLTMKLLGDRRKYGFRMRFLAKRGGGSDSVLSPGAEYDSSRTVPSS
jgi:hypothetical protein